MAGTVFAVLGAAVLISMASIAGKAWHIVSFSIYGASLIVLFLASSLHHGVNSSRNVENLLRILDYSAVFILISGTITPVCLVMIRTPLGWSVFGTVWLITVVGIALKASVKSLPKWVTNTLYLAAGWTSLILVKPLYNGSGIKGLSFVAAGGILYSIGAVIFAMEKPNPVPGRFGFHEIWHFFVIAGALCHYLFMYLFILPAG